VYYLTSKTSAKYLHIEAGMAEAGKSVASDVSVAKVSWFCKLSSLVWI